MTLKMTVGTQTFEFSGEATFPELRELAEAWLTALAMNDPATQQRLDALGWLKNGQEPRERYGVGGAAGVFDRVRASNDSLSAAVAARMARAAIAKAEGR